MVKISRFDLYELHSVVGLSCAFRFTTASLSVLSLIQLPAVTAHSPNMHFPHHSLSHSADDKEGHGSLI